MKSTQARAEFITCRAAVKRVLSGVLDVPAAEVALGRNPCPGCGSAEHGPPAVLLPATPWRISIAHTHGLGMLALSPFRVGIDVEQVRPLDVGQVDAPVLTRAEREAVTAQPEGLARATAFLRCWTRKEAVLKALGIGITIDLTTLESRAWAEGPAQVTTSALGSPSTWRMATVPSPAGWVAALALPAGADRPPSVRPL
ncbi:4'-phosphopantetheinyl transferase family protein [Streptomyces sp. NBC_00503]|uniref:4'-phosphopantetheinyl transferase family protein n=1 Tax=Streptomyces sp. NBC_00503 TaxID=2903659 RepID=UPI002E7FCFC8|nr:4'-phosphopantetheinyl transferase superfamily protein [Streptomyces sp. NBC_00503]WUD86351.1 4'-phosphopantetheinyl transferase superfamily protein [Streptomyces sp. NBC_00503]